MASVVRVKRRIDEDPADTILFSCKRLRSNESTDPEFGRALSDVKNLFKFAGTVDSKESTVTNHVREAMKHEKLKDQKSHVVDVVQKARESKKAAITKNRLKVVSSYRAADFTSLDETEAEDNPELVTMVSVQTDSTVSGTGHLTGGSLWTPGENQQHNNSAITKDTSSQLDKVNEALDGGAEASSSNLFLLYDVEQDTENVDTDPMQVASETTDTITCNNVPMVRKKVSEKSPSDKYVYDLYYMDSANFDFRALENILAIEAFHQQQVFVKDARNEEEEMYEDDDDSNDENNWRNDYPDEGEEDSDYHGDDGHEDGFFYDPGNTYVKHPDEFEDDYMEDYGMSEMIDKRLKIFDADDDDDDCLSSDQDDFACFNQPLDGASLCKPKSSYDNYKQQILRELGEEHEEENDMT